MKNLKSNKYIITKEPFMYMNNKWWIVVKNEEDYLFDIKLTSKQLFKFYDGSDFELFLEKAKSGSLNLMNYELVIKK